MKETESKGGKNKKERKSKPETEASLSRVSSFIDLMRSKGVLVLEMEGVKIALDARWQPAKEKKKENELTPHEVAAEEFLKHQNKLNMLEGGFHG